MNRSWIVCATCRSIWPAPGTPTTHFQIQLESQPCPRCEAYTLSCVGVLDVAVTLPQSAHRAEALMEPLAEAWRSTES